jgi:hypothetical protein
MFLIVSRGYGGTTSPAGAAASGGHHTPSPAAAGKGKRAQGAKKAPPRRGCGKPSRRARENRTAERGKTATGEARQTAERENAAAEARGNRSRRERENRSRRERENAARRRKKQKRACPPPRGWAGRSCHRDPLLWVYRFLFRARKKERSFSPAPTKYGYRKSLPRHISRPKPRRARVAPLRCPILAAIKS